MKHGLKPLKQNKKRYSFHRNFGGVAVQDLPQEFSVDLGLTMPDQNADGLYEACTAYAQLELCTDQDGKVYDSYRDLYQKTLDLEGSLFGSPCDMEDSLKMVVTYYGRGAYYQVESSKMDWFDSIRSVMYTNLTVNKWKCAVSIGTPWFGEFENINSTGIVPNIFTGNPSSVSWHNWAIKGWKVINGTPYLLAKTWQGKNYGDGGWAYFSRETINTVMKIRGTGAFTVAPRTEGNVKFTKLTIIGEIINFLFKLLALIKPPMNDYNTSDQAPQYPTPEIPPTPDVNKTAVSVDIAPANVNKLLWDTPENARHSVRVICDEEGLTVEQKNLMSQVVHCESGYKTDITHPNLLDGKQVSCDYGICQWNDYYHGKEITPDEAIHNPEKAVRLMCQYVKEGKINQWVCYSSGLYEKYSA